MAPSPGARRSMFSLPAVRRAVRSHGHRPGEPDGIRPGPRLIRSNKLIAGKGTVLMLHSHMCICMYIYIYI